MLPITGNQTTMTSGTMMMTEEYLEQIEFYLKLGVKDSIKYFGMEKTFALIWEATTEEMKREHGEADISA